MSQKAEAQAQEADAEDTTEDEEAHEPVKASAETHDVPAPTATQSVVPNPVLSATDEKAEKIAKIQASSMSGKEKIREITKLRFAQ